MSITNSSLAASNQVRSVKPDVGTSRSPRPAESEDPGKAKVAVVDDDQGVREAFAFQLNTAGFRVSAYASAREFLDTRDIGEVDCVLSDIYLPAMNGLQLQCELKHVAPYASIIFVTGHGDLPVAMNAVRNGAVDFLEKPVDDETLLFSVGIGADRSRMLRREYLVRGRIERGYQRLTPRERDAFVLITKGLLNKQVAAELGITERTVKAHRGQVMSKMSASSLADLVRMAEILQLHQAH